MDRDIQILCFQNIEGINDMGSSYEIELSMRELKFLLFKKKRCPKCDRKMKRTKKSEIIGNGLYSMNLGEFFYGEQHMVKILYCCYNCKTIYSIEDLAK